MKTFWIAAGVGTVAALGLAAAAAAQAAPAEKGHSTPFNYRLDSKGNPIRKGTKTVNPDGSWREVVPDGKCRTVKEMSTKGEYRETHECPTGGSGS